MNVIKSGGHHKHAGYDMQTGQAPAEEKADSSSFLGRTASTISKQF